jgi:predicted ribosomally synthesized peptide with SipW-like signal peptide
MARHSLRIVIVLGALITLLGGTGIFAVFNDRATTGTNDVTSGQLGRAADLQIATAPERDPMVLPPFDCGTFSDDLQTGLFTFTTILSGGNDANVCLQNVGNAALDLTTSAIDLVDLDIDCTGDEAAFGDATCGLDHTTMAPQAGELSSVLDVTFNVYSCDGGPNDPNLGGTEVLANLINNPIALGSLAPNASICVQIIVETSSLNPLDEVAQSDESTWRFAFDGVVPSN